MSDRYDLMVARQYTSRDGEIKSQFTKIGVAFAMRDRDGFSLSFEALPTPSLNRDGKLETRVLMMPPKPRDEYDQSPQRGRPSHYEVGSGNRDALDDMDSEIPF